MCISWPHVLTTVTPTFHHKIFTPQPQGPSLSSHGSPEMSFLKCHRCRRLLSQLFPSRHPCHGFGAYCWSWFALHVAEPEVPARLRGVLPLCPFLRREPTSVTLLFAPLALSWMQLSVVELGRVLASCCCVYEVTVTAQDLACPWAPACCLPS